MVAWSMSGRESLLGIFARWLGRRRRAIVPALLTVLRLVLVVAGLGLLVVAAWQASHIAGYAAGGAACLLLEWVVKRR